MPSWVNQSDSDEILGPHNSSIVFPAALAMALHNKLLYSTRYDIAFEQNPLAFLLAYCDNAQEWGRDQPRAGAAGEDGPILRAIDVSEEQSGPYVEIVLRFKDHERAMQKQRQLDALRGRLTSSEIDFRIRIHNSGNVWASRPQALPPQDRHRRPRRGSRSPPGGRLQSRPTRGATSEDRGRRGGERGGRSGRPV